MDDWRSVAFSSPAPFSVKRQVVLRNTLPMCTFIETGTYYGDTIEFVRGTASKIYSIEPHKKLFETAKERFSKYSNIKIIQGESDKILVTLLPTISGDVTFWLDGHFSGVETHKGLKNTLVQEELKLISKNAKQLGRLIVMVDDIRLFDPDLLDSKDYPTRSYLVNWADENGFKWTIEHDIFIAIKV